MTLLFLAAIDDPQKEEKFIKIYRKYRQLSYNIAIKILKNDTSAKIALQEAFYKIAKNIDSFATLDEEKIGIYVCISIKNMCYDMLKQQDKYDIPTDNLDHLESEEANAEQKLIKQEEQELLISCLRSLPSCYQIALTYRYLYGMSVKEIAGLTNTPVATVKSNLQRGKKILKKALEGGIA